MFSGCAWVLQICKTSLLQKFRTKRGMEEQVSEMLSTFNFLEWLVCILYIMCAFQSLRILY